MTDETEGELLEYGSLSSRETEVPGGAALADPTGNCDFGYQ